MLRDAIFIITIISVGFFGIIQTQCFAIENAPLPKKNELLDIDKQNDLEDWYMKSIVSLGTANLPITAYKVVKDNNAFHVYTRISMERSIAKLLNKMDLNIVLCPQRSDYITKIIDRYDFRFYIHQIDEEGNEAHFLDCQKQSLLLLEIHNRNVEWEKYNEIISK